jgi:hypothetical protein
VVLPLPVSPQITTTGYILIASIIGCSSARIGNSILASATEGRREMVGLAEDTG